MPDKKNEETPRPNRRGFLQAVGGFAASVMAERILPSSTRGDDSPVAPTPAPTPVPTSQPVISDDDLLDLTQLQTAGYMMDSPPRSGLAEERSNGISHYGKKVLTTGGSGFGIMAMVGALIRVKHLEFITKNGNEAAKENAKKK